MSLNIYFNAEHPTGYVPRHGGCGEDLACMGWEFVVLCVL